MKISADFMKIAEINKNGFNNTSFTATKNTSMTAMYVSRVINIHKLRCHLIHNYCYYTILMFVKRYQRIGSPICHSAQSIIFESIFLR